MPFRRIPLSTPAVLGAAALGLTAFAATPAMGQSTLDQATVLAAPCAGCHIPEAVEEPIIPGLAGRSANFIENSMIAYKTDAITGTVMNRIAKGYTEEQIRMIAEHLAAKEGSR